MKKTLSIVVACLVVAAVGVGLLQHFKPDTFKKFTGGSQAAEVKVDDFYLLDHQGRAQELHRQSGSKAVVLISTANGCPTMKEAAPKIKSLRDKFGSQGVVFWLIDSNPQDDRASIAKEVVQLGLD